MTDQLTHIPADQFIKEKSEWWRLHRTVSIRGNGGGGRTYEREAWTFLKETNADDNVFVVERLNHPDHGSQYRLGYWIVSRHGQMANRWTWGRFAPMIPAEDLERLMEKARSEGTIV